MNFCCLPSNQTDGPDQWVTGRNEGRAIINIGFALAELGHNVEISSKTFNSTLKQIHPRVNIVSDWNTDINYDYVIGYNLFNGAITENNFNKILYMFYGPVPDQGVIQKHFPKTCALLTPIRGIKEENPATFLPIEYFPHVYPITCYDKIKTQDFQPYNADLGKDTIKIWMNVSTWYDGHNFIIPDQTLLEIVRYIRDVIKKNIILTMCVNGINSLKSKPIASIVEEFSPHIVHTNDRNYLGVLNEIWDNDMCIIKGNIFSGAMSMIDIISLGKPMLYLASGLPSPGKTIVNRTIMDVFDKCLHSNDTISERNKKIDLFFEDPNMSCKPFQDSWRDNSFPVWKNIITPILNKYK